MRSVECVGISRIHARIPLHGADVRPDRIVAHADEGGPLGTPLARYLGEGPQPDAAAVVDVDESVGSHHGPLARDGGPGVVKDKAMQFVAHLESVPGGEWEVELHGIP